MNDTQVVTVANRWPRESYYRMDVFVESLRRFAEPPTILGMGEPWSGLMTKPFHYRKWLREKRNTRPRIIVSDSFDVIFAAHPHGIGDRCAELFGDAIVFNGEKGCWPRADLAEHFPDVGTPWRYLNSGFMCGPAEKILELLESMDLESVGVDHVRKDGTKSEPNDQGEFQKAFVAQPVKMVVDGRCQVAQTFSACTLDEFDFSSGRILNKLTGTYPGVLHGNGNSKELIVPTIMQTLNL